MKVKLNSFFADDIFISYSRKDANTYTVGLADELTKKGFTCFFDKLGTDANRNLPPSLIKRIRNCGMLVLVGSTGAYTSTFVAREIDEFIRANGSMRIVPIDLGGKIDEATWYPQVVGIATEVEPISTLASGNPSPSVVSRIEKSFTYLRSKERLRRYTVGAAITLVLLLTASVGAGLFAKQQFAQARTATATADKANLDAKSAAKNADEQKQRAEDARSKADSANAMANRENKRAQIAENTAKESIVQARMATAEANREKQLAYIESRRAEEERIKAATEAEKAKAGRLVSTAQALMDDDPTTASLVLTETNPSVEPTGGVTTARELLNRYVTKRTLRGHGSLGSDSGINSVAYSADGSRIVTNGRDGTIRLWENNLSGRSIALPGAPGLSFNKAAFRPDGKYIISSSPSEFNTSMWNTSDLTKIVTLQGGGGRFSPDSKHVLTYNVDTILVYNGEGSGKPMLLPHTGYVSCAAFSRNSELIGAATGDSLVYVWKLDSAGKPIIMSGHGKSIYDLDFSYDNKYIATVSEDRTARIWRIDSGKGRQTILLDHKRYGQPQNVKFSPDGKTIATGILGNESGGGYVVLWNLSGIGEPIVLQGTGQFHGPPRSIVFSKDGKLILVAWLDGRTELWHTDGSGIVAVIRGHQGTVYNAVFSPDEREIATASEDNTAKIWTKLNRDEPVIFKGSYSGADFSPDGKRVVFPSPMWDTTNKNVAVIVKSDGSGNRVILRGHKETVSKARFSPDGASVLTASFDGTARIWSADGSGSPKVLEGHDGPVAIAEYSPDGIRIVTVTNSVMKGEYATNANGIIHLWLEKGNKGPLVFKGHVGEIHKINFSIDGKHFLSAGADGTVRIWPSDGSGEPMILRPHHYESVDACFDNTGTRVVSVSTDKTAVIQNADGTGKPIVWDFQRELKSCQFSPDGKQVVIVAENDKNVYLWNTVSDNKSVLSGHTQMVNSARFSGDGRYIVTTSYDGRALIWRSDGTGEPVSLHNKTQDDFSRAEFSPEGKRILTISSSASGAYAPIVQIWTVDWNELMGLLRARTGECLTVPQRMKYLHEDETEATKRLLDCETGFGREIVTPD